MTNPVNRSPDSTNAAYPGKRKREIEFDANGSPLKQSSSPPGGESLSARVYSASVSPDSRKIRLHTTPTSKKKQGIYKLYNEKTGETYVGKTSQAFQKRLSQHASCANDEKNSAPVYEALRESPEDFRFAIVQETRPQTPDCVLSELEQKHIQAIPEEKRLNANEGGGGGSSRKSLFPPQSSSSSPPELFESPVKYTPFKKAGDRILLPLTPTSKKEKGVVYVIKEDETDKRYIGMTSQPLSKRMSQHTHLLKHPGKADAPLYQEMRENPERFSVGILAKHVPPGDLPELERDYIRKKDSVAKGFNGNSGGGGSASSKFT